MTTGEFVFDLYQDNCWSYGPQSMTLDDAAYNLRCYAEENREIPDDCTPERFTLCWNILYAHDTREVI